MELCNPDLRWTDFKFVRLHINLDIAHKQRPSGWPDPKMIARKQAQVCVVYHQYRRLVCKCVAKDDCVMKMSSVLPSSIPYRLLAVKLQIFGPTGRQFIYAKERLHSVCVFPLGYHRNQSDIFRCLQKWKQGEFCSLHNAWQQLASTQDLRRMSPCPGPGGLELEFPASTAWCLRPFVFAILNPTQMHTNAYFRLRLLGKSCRGQQLQLLAQLNLGSN